MSASGDMEPTKGKNVFPYILLSLTIFFGGIAGLMYLLGIDPHIFL